MLKNHKPFISVLILLGAIVSGSVLATELPLYWAKTPSNNVEVEDGFVINTDLINDLILQAPAGTLRQNCLDNAFADWRNCLKKAKADPAKQNACHTGFREYKDYCKSRF